MTRSLASLRIVRGYPLLGVAALLFAAGGAGLGTGIVCYTRPDPGLGCAALTGLVPLAAWPLALGLALVGAAQAGWLRRRDADEARDEDSTGGGRG